MFYFQMTRDPRFDDLSGEFNEHYFKSNYSFLFDIKAREKEVNFTIMKNDAFMKMSKRLLYQYIYVKEVTVSIHLCQRGYCINTFMSKKLLYQYIYVKEVTVSIHLCQRSYCINTLMKSQFCKY
jgi:hypothetical protein